jgi:hypothetical protein
VDVGPSMPTMVSFRAVVDCRTQAGGRALRAVGGAWILVVAITIAFAGCGAAHPRPDQQRVKDVVHSYLRAQVAGDGKSACALLTAGAQDQLVALVLKAGKGSVTTRPSCRDAVALVTVVAGQQLLNALKTAGIENVQVQGAQASAMVVLGDGEAQKVALVKSGTAWKIAGVPGLGALLAAGTN